MTTRQLYKSIAQDIVDECRIQGIDAKLTRDLLRSARSEFRAAARACKDLPPGLKKMRAILAWMSTEAEFRGTIQ
jgi:hypothetical protein